MNKIALTSLLAMCVASGASAASLLNGDPLYMPGQNNFYSVSTLGSHTETTDAWTAGEEFGYGITDRLAVVATTDLGETDGFHDVAWGNFGLSTIYRVLDDANWKFDVYGKYNLAPVWASHRPFLDEDDTGYTWTAGVRGGYTTNTWTVAGHVAFDYLNSESFNWGDDGMHQLRAGVDALARLDCKWSVLAGAEYTGVLDKEWYGVDGAKVKNAGTWDLNLGVNYNITDLMYVGAYVDWTLDHHQGNKADEWGFEDGFGFGAKFGIQF